MVLGVGLDVVMQDLLFWCLFLVFIFGVVVEFFYLKKPQHVLPRKEFMFRGDDGIEKARVVVEMAETFLQKTRGLMGRTSLGENEGMYFRWNRSGRNAITMKNTIIPLDIVFLDENGVVVEIAEGRPKRRIPVGMKVRSSGTVEVPFGFCEKHHVVVGDVFVRAGGVG